LKGGTWTQISTYSFGGALAGVEISPVDSKIIYAFRGKNLYRTTNGGTSFTDITGTITGTITSVEADYANKDKIWVTVGGWVNGTKIYFSSDGGSTWTNVTKNLPNFPANIIKQEIGNSKDAIYIGLDVGIYYTDNTMNEWVPFMNELANSSVRDLEINEKTHLIRAATFGRGVWESYTYDYTTGITTTDTEEIKIYPNPSPGIFTIKLDGSIRNEVIRIEAYNQLGEKVYSSQTKLNEDQLDVNISSLPKGTYLLRFSNDNMIRTAKVIKQ
jgi:xyloglucan-specific exo-beta-1,4-glucanase